MFLHTYHNTYIIYILTNRLPHRNLMVVFFSDRQLYIIILYAFNILIDFEQAPPFYPDSYYSYESDALNATVNRPPAIIYDFGYIYDNKNNIVITILFLYGSSSEIYIIKIIIIITIRLVSLNTISSLLMYSFT